MRQLLHACANVWASAGATDLEALVLDVDTDAECGGLGVPDHLQNEYQSALSAMNVFPALKKQLLAKGQRLHWSEGSMHMPAGFQGKFAYVELAGPKGMVVHDEVSFGLYLQSSNTVYPSHWHEAVEHYLVLSGVAAWQMDDAEYTSREPGSIFVHRSNQPHATTTVAEPLLAMWFWQGNISDSTYRIIGVDK